LARLPPGRFHPFELDTFGVGRLLQAAAASGAVRCLVGIGGSATNDGGFGLARALGWQFCNKHGAVIARWTELHGLTHLHPPDAPPRFAELVGAVDVQNPLLGPSGCTRIYGPQKGLGPEDFECAERCLQQLALVVEKQLGLAAADEPGAGAAGGLGYGLRCFAGAGLEPGFSLFAQQADLRRRVAASQLVLTGEGAARRRRILKERGFESASTPLPVWTSDARYDAEAE
jgi:glycerate kinase